MTPPLPATPSPLSAEEATMCICMIGPGVAAYCRVHHPERYEPEMTPPLPATPPLVLRLTGEQIGSIDPPVSGDWFVDFDEYEEFVTKREYDGIDAERIAATTRVEGLREAAQFMVTLIDEVYGTDNEGMDLPEEAEFRRYRAVIEAALAEAPARPPDTIEDHGIVFGDPDA